MTTRLAQLAYANLPRPVFLSARYLWRLRRTNSLRLARAVLPKSKWGDAIYLNLVFSKFHRRKPDTNSMRINDFLFRMLCGPEVDEPLRHRVTDKELLKEYVREKLGDEFNVPTLAVLRSLPEALHYAYPRRCVIKPTHLSGAVFLRHGGEPIDFYAIDNWFNTDYYDTSRVRYYRYLQPKVIVEPFVFDCDSPHDYKVFCWRGEPKMIQVVTNRSTDSREAYYDTNWRRLWFRVHNPHHEEDIERPGSLHLILEASRALSADYNFMRVDLYTDGAQVAVGELTSIPLGAQMGFRPGSAEEDASRVIFGSDFR